MNDAIGLITWLKEQTDYKYRCDMLDAFHKKIGRKNVTVREILEYKDAPQKRRSAKLQQPTARTPHRAG